jgi:putative flippase GtrA
VTDVRATPRSSAAHHQVLRFLVVGALTVLVDFVVYRLLHHLGLALTPAKTCSFAVATVCAYFLNRSFTFGATGGRRVATSFVALYTCALGINVGINAVGLAELPAGRFHILGAFLCAQAVSSTFNFVGMRQLVFTRRRGG